MFGDRNWDNPELIEKYIVILNEFGDLVVIEGEARGADTHARLACEKHRIPFESYPANWEKYGKAAGPIRNKQMIIEGKPTHGLGFHRSITESRGSKNMRDQLIAAHIPVRIIDGRERSDFEGCVE